MASAADIQKFKGLKHVLWNGDECPVVGVDATTLTIMTDNGHAIFTMFSDKWPDPIPNLPVWRVVVLTDNRSVVDNLVKQAAGSWSTIEIHVEQEPEADGRGL